MKRHAIIFIILFAGFQASPSSADVPAAPAERVDQQDHDINLEQSVFRRKNRLGAILQPSARKKLDLAAKKLVSLLAKDPEHMDLYTVVRREIGKGFSNLSIDQGNLLVFYVLAESAMLISGRENLKSGAESIGELSEMASLRLQIAMDRQSKFMRTLSNMMRKISTTQDAMVQNIK
ncbi:MAG: hypothetical protein HGB36_01035 [Chlorobiaceae bacterium]|nr:hypothetical protein [Chlorobiaceae bacterium]